VHVGDGAGDVGLDEEHSTATKCSRAHAMSAGMRAGLGGWPPLLGGSPRRCTDAGGDSSVVWRWDPI
jgi:hypothetical protein